MSADMLTLYVLFCLVSWVAPVNSYCGNQFDNKRYNYEDKERVKLLT